MQTMTDNVGVYQGCFWHCILHDKCKIFSATIFWIWLTYIFLMQDFWHFFVIRGLVGIGEASYSTVSPTLIADMFVKDHRTRALSLFYFAIPCGRYTNCFMLSIFMLMLSHQLNCWIFGNMLMIPTLNPC